MASSKTRSSARCRSLRRGAERLGIEVETIARNVRGCYNLGYCGVA